MTPTALTTPETATLLAARAEGLSKSFGEVHAVRDFSLTIEPGEIVALLGPNGAGKTTAIDLLLGLQAPDTGEVSLWGMTPRAAIERGLAGAVLQTGALLRDYRVAELLQLIAATTPHARNVNDVLDQVGITHLARRTIRKCSGGEIQRVRVAVSLITDPLFIFLDEPTVGMDVASRASLWESLQHEAARGRTIVFATHYLAEAQQFAQRTIIMREGTIIADGATHELAEQYAASQLTIDYDCSDDDALQALSHGNRWEVDATGGHAVVTGHDLDGAARSALALPGAHNLTLTKSTIEDAYIALTGQKKQEDK